MTQKDRSLYNYPSEALTGIQDPYTLFLGPSSGHYWQKSGRTCIIWDQATKKILFVSCNGLRKNRVGRLIKKKFLHYSLGQKCVFYI